MAGKEKFEREEVKESIREFVNLPLVSDLEIPKIMTAVERMTDNELNSFAEDIMFARDYLSEAFRRHLNPHM
ncbi:MAG: hypothetical protein CVU57_06330 [Deltaproteobacteria bacterium HGW-Deltaproteobacteria-15]|jgi:hypothetical protein|nr:MAG: hypothetical protein CVU57_06330 [Deltaproteobacteria bacterium HGW-Deltaproteobacteria-15]